MPCLKKVSKMKRVRCNLIRHSLIDLFAEHSGKVSDKWSLYLTEYDRLLQPYRDQPSRLLEIGIQNGGSLEIWSKYFPSAEKFVGCDINPNCAQLQFDDPRIALVVANANSDEAEQQILAHSPKFDVIIDDGSHQSGDIVRSFARYFSHLSDGGLFIAEDLHCSYWQEFEGGIFQPYSSIAFFKRLADTINHEHWGVDKTRCELMRSFNREYDTRFDEITLAHIHSIEFINSMCVIRKAQPTDNVLGRRFVVGVDALIYQYPVPLYGTSTSQPDQSGNQWSARDLPVEEELTVRIQEVSHLNQAAHDKDVHINNLDHALAEHGWQIETLKKAVHDKNVLINNLDQTLAERERLIATFNDAVVERGDRIAALSQILTELETQLITLNRAAHDKDVHIDSLNQELAKHEKKIGSLEVVVSAQSGRIELLAKTLDERDAQLFTLNQAVHDKDVHIGNLDHALAEHVGTIDVLIKGNGQKDMRIHQMHINSIQQNYRLELARSSLGWKLFKPVRTVKNLLTYLNRMLSGDIIPLDQLQRNGANWLSTGHDPQFLLMTERAWHGLAGWYWMDVDVVAKQPLAAQLYFDIGAGFDPHHVINIQLAGKGLQRVPFFVPPNCHAIRLDPCDFPATFRLFVLGLTRLSVAPELPDEFLAQSAVYEALGWREGYAAALEPANEIQLIGEADYCWRSEGSDPWFTLKSSDLKLRAGWYMIELRIRSTHERGNAKLYFDYGEGYGEVTAVALPFSNGQIVKRLYHQKDISKQVRFDPFEDAGKFSVERLHFAPVKPVFAQDQMLQRLRSQYAHYTDQSISGIWRDLQKQANAKNVSAEELLYRRYNETFPANGLHDSISYAEWIAKFETPEFSDLVAIEIVQKSFAHQPTISIVMPAYNTEERHLRQAIESVLLQSYSHWELCIADDASPRPHVRAVLEEYAQRDPRIKVAYRPKNGHISAASNSALALATGEYVALMDHDDTLANHALHFMVAAINQNPSAQILYSDEDKIDGQGNRTEPHFKPDWNPDLFFSQNYVSHLGVYRRELLQRINGFRVGVEGSQDQDLLLRCLPYVNPAEIIHIPKVLYHWRMVEGSTALASGEKNYTTSAGIKALRDYFTAQGQHDIQVEAELVPNTYRVRYPIPQPEPLVSLLIPTRDMLVMLEPCIRSILDKSTYQNYEIIILDNESIQPATLDYFKRIQAEDTRVKVLSYHQPFNYSAINNYGVQHAKGELIGLINNDIEVITPEWLTEMVSHALRPGIGCVGAKLYYEDETIQHAGVILGVGGVAGHSHKHFPRAATGYFSRLKLIQNLSAVTAACLVVRKAIYEQVSGLEEEALRVAFNDVDFCLKIRKAGYRNLWTPYAELYHYESKSRGAEDTPEKIARFNSEVEYVKTKWGEPLRRDPYYSQNLTLAREDFSIGN